MEKLFLISPIIGLLALDTTIAFQILLSQPLFACPIIGWVLGDPVTGFYVGLLLQMLWLSDLPMGAVTPPEGNVASMVATVLIIWFQDMGKPNSVLLLAVFTAVVVSYFGAKLTIQDRKWNAFFLEKALQAAEHAGIREIAFWNGLAIFIYFILITIFTWIVLFISIILFSALIPAIPQFLESRFAIVEPAIWGIGFGLSLRLVYRHILRRNP